MIDSQDRMNWVGSNGEYNTLCGTYSACRSDDHPGKWMLAVRCGDGPEKIVGYFNTRRQPRQRFRTNVSPST